MHFCTLSCSHAPQPLSLHTYSPTHPQIQGPSPACASRCCTSSRRPWTGCGPRSTRPRHVLCHRRRRTCDGIQCICVRRHRRRVIVSTLYTCSLMMHTTHTIPCCSPVYTNQNNHRTRPQNPTRATTTTPQQQPQQQTLTLNKNNNHYHKPINQPTNQALGGHESAEVVRLKALSLLGPLRKCLRVRAFREFVDGWVDG